MTALEPRIPTDAAYGAVVRRGWSLDRCRIGALGGLVALQTLLTTTDRLSPTGWVVGVSCAATLLHVLDTALTRAGRRTLTPADVVTLTRATIACTVAGLTADVLTGGPGGTATLVGLAVVALLLDAVDGRVARRTGTVTRFGGRFDGEVDAALILVLSAAAGATAGWWLLGAGLARYVFGAAAAPLPWLRAELPFRHWRKVVTAVVGVALTAVASGLLPRPIAVAAGVVALGLLAESFGRDVRWLWVRRPRTPSTPAPRGRGRMGTRAADVVALFLLTLAWCALLVPARPEPLTPQLVLRLPVEALALAGAVLLTRGAARRVVAVVAGVLLGVVTLTHLLDIGTYAVLDRPFDAVSDIGSLSSGLSFLRDSAGPWVAAGAVVATGALLALLLGGMPWAVGRASRAGAAHHGAAWRTVAAGAAAWGVLAALGVPGPTGTPLAAAEAAPYLASEVSTVGAGLHDRAAFQRAVADDRFKARGSGDLAALRGKDVVVVVVESYGRVALEGAQAAPVRQQLDAGTAHLAAVGFTARSAYLTSSTFGAGSWLAHATLESGLWVDRQSRYDALLATDRSTLASVFAREGWRTVAVMPSTVGDWPQGRAFYRFDRVYGSQDLGYAGPSFGFSTMPDQYALTALSRLELDRPGRSPVMAQVELTSSHAPWAPLPTTVDAADLGNGAIFTGVVARAQSAAQLWQDPAAVPAAYRTSIGYALRSVESFVDGSRDDDLVVVVVGDHQPSTVVTGSGAGRDVPVTIVARDPAVLRAAASWGWQPGLRPGPAAPVWRMDAFRDRFLTAFSSSTARGGP